MAPRDARFACNALLLAEDDQSGGLPESWAGSLPRSATLPQTQQAYLKRILLHPFHVALVITIVTFSLFTSTWWVLPLMLIAEVVFGTFVSSSRRFRQIADNESYTNQLLLPPQQRAELVAQMSDEHRRQLERLEVQAENICANCKSDEDMLVEQPADLSLLLRAFADLATEYQAHAAALAAMDRVALLEELRSLEDTEPLSDKLAKLIARRRDIVRQRLMWWNQNTQAMQEIEHQLATITSLIGLIHERSIVQSQACWASDEIDRISDLIEQRQQDLFDLQ